MSPTTMSSLEKYFELKLWVLFFGYSVCLALVFQNLIVSNIPAIHGAGKLLAHDAIHFDKLAWSLAQEIREFGWDRWKLYIDYSAPANVSILAAFYAVWGHDPSLVVPINAALHAMGGLLVFCICREIAEFKKVGTYAGLVASSLFITFPSSLSWYGQIHKDSYAIAGTLLLLFLWIRVLGRPIVFMSATKVTFFALLACLLIGIVRPYGLTLQIAVFSSLFLLAVIQLCPFNLDSLKRITGLGIIVIALLGSGMLTKHYNFKVNDGVASQKLSFEQSPISSEGQVLEEWAWQSSGYLPNSAERYLAGAARTRAMIIKHDHLLKARSTIDPERMPNSVGEMLSYFPRALQVAVLAPFPSSWFVERGAIKLLASVEMLVYYLFLPGVILLLFFNRNKQVVATLFYTASLLTIYGFIVANMGTLYRMRYAYWFLIVMMGALGWFYCLERVGLLAKVSAYFKTCLRPSENSSLSSMEVHKLKGRGKVLSSSIIVMLLTLISFIGFFYRDILLAYTFGLSSELDSFFIALVIPMIFVTIMCMPLGAAFTPLFLNSVQNQEKALTQKMISSLVGVVSSALLLISMFLVVILPIVLDYFYPNTITAGDSSFYVMSTLALSILFFSGVLIIGNAILNALERAKIAAFAQLMVPVFAISLIWLLGERYGVVTAVLGMVVGQLANLIIVQIMLKRLGYSLKPTSNFVKYIPYRELSVSYLVLLVSAFYTGALVFVNTMIAAGLEEGSVASFSLGTKIVLFITGLLTAVMTSTVLPHFSKLIAQKNLLVARKDLSFFLNMITLLTIPISIFLIQETEWVINIIFSVEYFSTSELEELASVMTYSAIQIPFIATSLLLIKFATATKHIRSILLSAVAGLAINLALVSVLKSNMGVSGIALSTSVSMIISTALLTSLLFYLRSVELIDFISVSLYWLLFLTLFMCINFDSSAGVVSVAIGFVSLFCGFHGFKFRRKEKY